MKATDQVETGLPLALQTIADVDKAAAITAAFKAVTGESPEARIEMIDYSGRLGQRGPFMRYAEMLFGLYTPEADLRSDNMVEAMRQVDDATLADAIANKLGQLANDDFKGYIASKRIGTRRNANGQLANIRIQIALA